MPETTERSIEQLKAAVEFAKQAISFTFLLNGGALVGMLTFMGNALDKLAPEKLEGLTGASGYFIGGLVMATLCSIIAYVAQLNYYKRDSGIDASVSDPSALRYVLTFLLVLSIAAFSVGAMKAFEAMTV